MSLCLGSLVSLSALCKSQKQNVYLSFFTQTQLRKPAAQEWGEGWWVREQAELSGQVRLSLARVGKQRHIKEGSLHFLRGFWASNLKTRCLRCCSVTGHCRTQSILPTVETAAQILKKSYFMSQILAWRNRLAVKTKQPIRGRFGWTMLLLCSDPTAVNKNTHICCTNWRKITINLKFMALGAFNKLCT